MATYTLVRESHTGRQSPDEPVHCITDDAEETYCGEFARAEVRTVRTLAVFTGDAPFCEDCREAVTDLV